MSYLQIVEHWNSEKIVCWLRGVDGSLKPYLENIAKSGIDGRSLFLLDDDGLTQLGLTSYGAKHIVLQAVDLLRHLCFGLKNENLQSLCMRVSVCACELATTLKLLEKQKVTMSRLKFIVQLNIILACISRAIEEIKKLLCWLDRSPFDRLKWYCDFRSEILTITLDLARSICVTRKQLMFTLRHIKKLCDDLINKCKLIIRDSEDPLILYTAYLEKTILRRHNPSDDWGINLQSSYHGVHVVSEVKLKSPADVCGKIDAGDEIIQINDDTVLGWNVVQVAKKLASGNLDSFATELVLIAKKRPREAITPSFLNNAHSPCRTLKVITLKGSRSLLKVVPGTQQTTISLQINEQDHQVLNVKSSRKQRSASLQSNALANQFPHSEVLEQSFSANALRRATVSCGTPPNIYYGGNLSLDDLYHNTAEELSSITVDHFKNAEDENSVLRRRRFMRRQLGGYVRSFIDNHVITDDKSSYLTITPVTDYNIDCIIHLNDNLDDVVITIEPDSYALIEVIDSQEIETLNIPTINLIDWDSYLDLRLAVDSDGCVAGTHENDLHHYENLCSLSSTMSKSKSKKIEEKPICKPTETCQQAPIAEFDESSNEYDTESESVIFEQSSSSHSGPEVNALLELAKIPYSSIDDKSMEGCMRRKRLEHEVSPSGSKWIRCWMVLRSSVLLIYTDKIAKTADIVIAVPKFFVADAPYFKTSKKHVFRLYRRSITFYFSAYSNCEMKTWMNKLGLATICYAQSEEEKKNSDALSQSMFYVSTLDESKYLSLLHESPTSSPVHHTLPRTKGLKSTARRRLRASRQTSLVSIRSQNSFLSNVHKK